MLVEIICMIYFTIRTCHHAHWKLSHQFFKDVKNVFVIGILIVSNTIGHVIKCCPSSLDSLYAICIHGLHPVQSHDFRGNSVVPHQLVSEEAN